MFENYTKAYPDKAAEFERRSKGEMPAGWLDSMPTYSSTEAKAAATRNRSEEVYLIPYNSLILSLISYISHTIPYIGVERHCRQLF